MGMKWGNVEVEGVECFCLSQTGFFLLTTKETKLPAENFCFEVSALAHTVHPQKFVRPDLSRTEIVW